MAIRIPTNFNLPAPAHLDKRTGLAQNINDLRNWDFTENPIPVGFEVCVGGIWYTYLGQSQENLDTATGYFRERGGINVVQETGESTINVMSQNAVTEQLESLQNRIQNIIENLGIILEIRVEEFSPEQNESTKIITGGGGLYKKGSIIIPRISWKTYYNGEIVPVGEVENINVYPIITEDDGSEVEGGALSGTLTKGTSEYPDTIFWEATATQITTNTKLRLRINYGSGVAQLVASQDIDFTFVNSRVWGYIDTNSVDSAIVESFLASERGKIIGDDLSLSRELTNKVFDCSGEEDGVYPIYLIPSDIYNNDSGNPIVLVGNIEVSTYTITPEVNQILINHGTDSYRAIVFNVKQRGILNIEVKNYG